MSLFALLVHLLAASAVTQGVRAGRVVRGCVVVVASMLLSGCVTPVVWHAGQLQLGLFAVRHDSSQKTGSSRSSTGVGIAFGRQGFRMGVLCDRVTAIDPKRDGSFATNELTVWTGAAANARACRNLDQGAP